MLRVIAERGPVRVPEIAQAIGSSKSTIERDVSALRSAGRIRFDGRPSTGGYVATDSGE